MSLNKLNQNLFCYKLKFTKPLVGISKKYEQTIQTQYFWVFQNPSNTLINYFLKQLQFRSYNLFVYNLLKLKSASNKIRYLYLLKFKMKYSLIKKLHLLLYNNL